MGNLITILNTWVYNQDIKKPVQLYGIGRVELPKLILAWKGSFSTSKFESVLWNGILELKFEYMSPFKLLEQNKPLQGRMGHTFVGHSRLKSERNPQSLFSTKFCS